ncbi:MAG: rod shape-determining protein MreC [Bacteroidales bacterium]|nr:rod shape-determining protein MreC [Bacteroidales bacterium]
MWGKSPFIRALTTLLLFLALQGFSLIIISRESLFQSVRIGGVVMHLKTGVSGFTSDINYYFGLGDVNDMLRAENLKLLRELELYKKISPHSDSLLKSGEVTPDFSYIPAKVVANSTNKLHNYIILNKGRKNGVEKDMGVISPRGVVGVVTSVSDHFSYVISFLNINQSVSAKITPSMAFGPLIWEGRRTDYATLIEIPYHINFMVGDTVYTSGFSTLFPPDLPLGTVRKSEVTKGSHHNIQVKLFQDFSTLHYVNIVVNNNKEELDLIQGRTNGKDK